MGAFSFTLPRVEVSTMSPTEESIVKPVPPDACTNAGDDSTSSAVPEMVVTRADDTLQPVAPLTDASPAEERDADADPAKLAAPPAVATNAPAAVHVIPDPVMVLSPTAFEATVPVPAIIIARPPRVIKGELTVYDVRHVDRAIKDVHV